MLLFQLERNLKLFKCFTLKNFYIQFFIYKIKKNLSFMLYENTQRCHEIDISKLLLKIERFNRKFCLYSILFVFDNCYHVS